MHKPLYRRIDIKPKKTKNILRTVLQHMFSGKSLKYRLYTISWTAMACRFWTGNWFETFELTATIVIGKFLYYGLWEFWHLEVLDGKNWPNWKRHVFDFSVIVSSLIIEGLILWYIIGPVIK